MRLIQPVTWSFVLPWKFTSISSCKTITSYTLTSPEFLILLYFWVFYLSSSQECLEGNLFKFGTNVLNVSRISWSDVGGACFTWRHISETHRQKLLKLGTNVQSDWGINWFEFGGVLSHNSRIHVICTVKCTCRWSYMLKSDIQEIRH